jgi:hypothetical protein
VCLCVCAESNCRAAGSAVLFLAGSRVGSWLGAGAPEACDISSACEVSPVVGDCAGVRCGPFLIEQVCGILSIAGCNAPSLRDTGTGVLGAL